MRVLVIIPSGSCFGLQNISFDYIDELVGSCEFSFLISKWADGRFARRLDDRNLPYIATWFGFMARSLNPRYLWMTLNYFVRLPWLAHDYFRALRLYRPEVIWVANYNEIRVIGLFLLFKRVPVVCHMHDPPPSTPFFKRMFRWVSRQVTRYAVISRYVGQCCQTLGCDPAKVEVIPNGIKIEDFPFSFQRGKLFVERFNWPENAFIFGVTGQMMREKGHEILLRAFKQTASEIAAVRLVIGGRDLDQPFAIHLKQLIKEWNLADKVSFSGWLDHPVGFYQNIDTIVMPSLLKEGFGLSLAEGMLCGCSAIGSAHGGLVEVSEEGRAGLLFPPGNAAALAVEMHRLASDRRLHEDVRRKGRAYIEKNFNLQRQASAFHSVLLKTCCQPEVS